jgi:hypothetical protein
MRHAFIAVWVTYRSALPGWYVENMDGGSLCWTGSHARCGSGAAEQVPFPSLPVSPVPRRGRCAEAAKQLLLMFPLNLALPRLDRLLYL